MPNQIKEHALFIADAHYPHHGDAFFKILKDLEEGKIKTPQLFLMGDIFDLLFGYSAYIQTFSQEAITLLQKLSLTMEIHYIEGNHDFCLEAIFPHIKVYTREKQPVRFRLNNQDIYLAHGDNHKSGFVYNLYSTLLRNRITLTLLKVFEKRIIDHRIERLKSKQICGHFVGYQKRFDGIRECYPKASLIVEGHFHQGVQYKNYISLPSLACQNQIGIISNKKLIFKTV